MDKKCPSIESGMAGKAESCKGCPNANICASSKPDEDIPIIIDNLKKIKMIVAVISGKGGVGKSTISCNIASVLADRGIKTMIMDMDLSGPSIPRLTNTLEEFIYTSDSYFQPINVRENLKSISLGYIEGSDDVIVYNSTTKNFILKKIFKYCDFSGIDVLVIDTPPNITDEHLALASYVKPTYGIIISTPQKLSLDDVKRQSTFCKKTSINILGVVENMKYFECPKCLHLNRIFNEVGVKEFCNQEGFNFFGSIPLKSSYAKDSDKGIPIKNPVFETIAENIISELNKQYF